MSWTLGCLTFVLRMLCCGKQHREIFGGLCFLGDSTVFKSSNLWLGEWGKHVGATVTHRNLTPLKREKMVYPPDKCSDDNRNSLNCASHGSSQIGMLSLMFSIYNLSHLFMIQTVNWLEFNKTCWNWIQIWIKKKSDCTVVHCALWHKYFHQVCDNIVCDDITTTQVRLVFSCMS